MARFKIQEVLHAALKAILEGASTHPLIKIPASFISQLASLEKKTQGSDSKHNPHDINTIINWQNIDSALQRLIVHESGSIFQRLANSLAKERWPQIISPEIHNDGGEDGFLPSYFRKDGKYLSVGCSIAAKYSKIKGDAQKIVARKQLDIFVFYTPHKISSSAGKNNIVSREKWAKKLKHELGCDLLLITREDIIQELLKPDNRWMCREHLGLNVPYAVDIQPISKSAKAASQEIIDRWQKRLLSDDFLIELTINEKSKNKIDPINHEEIISKLHSKHRFTLYGSPGSGKTTTLIQVAQKLIDQDLIPLLVYLPLWIDSASDNIIDYLIDKRVFSSRGITKDKLLSLYESGKIVFLLNGLNEVESSKVTEATRRLRGLDIDFAASGIIVATRENNFKPPFIDESILELKDLSNDQRRDIIKQQISDTWEEVSIQIEDDNSLSQVTKTPLFLVELIKIYQDKGTLPRTRVEIFEQVIERIEHSSEHSEYLQSTPMCGRSECYLVQLSIYAIRSDQVTIKNNDACREIVMVNDQLQLSGQLQTKPEPIDIINLLCDQHILVRSEKTIRFVHQQFQEYYAYLFIKERLEEIIADLDDNKIVEFQKDIINYPVWEESLRLLVDEISEKLATSPDDEHALKTGVFLVRWTIPVDPVFAAALVKILGDEVWDIVKTDIEPILRKWYECPDKYHRKCALAAMFATGKDAFTDIIWPLLENEDNQVRLTTYRTAKIFSVSSLGSNWKERVDSWSEECRSEFLSELSLNGETDAVGIFEDFAQNDPSTKVKVAAINAVGWYAPRSKLHEVISVCDDETFKTIIQHDYIINKFSDNMIPKATKFYLQSLKGLDDLKERLRLLLRMNKLCGAKVVKLLKKELRDFQPEKSDYSFVNSILKMIVSEDPNWVNLWVCQQIANGNLNYDHYSGYISKVPGALIDKLLKDFVKPDYSKHLEFKTIQLIALGAKEKHIHIILQEIIRISSKLKDPKTSISNPDRDIYSRLIHVARLLPLQSFANVILKYYDKPDSVVLSVVLDLLQSYSQAVESDESLMLEEETLHSLQQLLYNYLNLVLEEDEYHGNLKSDILCVLAVFGKPQDFPLIERLFKRDIEERRSLTEDRRRYARCGLQVRYLSKMNSDKVEKLLLYLLNEPEYENDAANGLAQLLWKEVPKEKQGPVFHDPLIIGSLKWREEYIDSAKRKNYAQAIVQRINDKREEDSSCAPKTLAGHLSKLNDPDTIPLILEVLDIPQKFDGFRRLNPLEMLVRNGHCLDTTAIINVLGPAIEQAVSMQSGSGENSMYLLTQCLSVLVCTNDMTKAISFIDKIIKERNLLSELRNLVETLGNRKTSEAAEYLIHLCQDKRLYKYLCYELIKALGKTETSEAKQALFSTVDNSVSSHKIPMPNADVSSSLEQVLGNIYRSDTSMQERVISLCDEKNISKERKALITSVININPSNKAVLAAISMVSQDNEECHMSWELKESIERCLIQYVPDDDFPDCYSRSPQFNSELSKSLFETLIDKEGNWMFYFKLLGYINRLRIKYGRPLLESRHPQIESGKPWPPLELLP